MECPFARLDPFGDDYLADPYPAFAHHRENTPVFYDEALDHYVVSRHGDVVEVFRDADTFSAANAQDPVSALHPDTLAMLADAGFRKVRTMSNLDGPEHTRIRQHNQVGFSPRRLRTLEPIVRRSADDLVDAMASDVDRCVDFVRALSFPLSAGVIFALLGFPPEDTEQLKTWCGDRMAFSWGRPTPDAQRRIAADMLAYWDYCERHVERRVAEPADDFTTDLLRIHLQDPSTLSRAEIAHVIYGMSFAGHETTTNLLSNTLRRLLENGLWTSLVNDPSLIGGAVEEGLRHDSSVLVWRRVATRATTVGDVSIPAGGRLLLLLGSANHDPAVFDDPERFDPHRAGSNRHVSFGFGKHYCLGATLAKLEVRIVLELLTTQFPSLRLTEGQELQFHPNVSFRGPQRLSIEW